MAEVLFLGRDPGPSPTGALNTVVQLVANAPRDASASYFTPPPADPASLNPSESLLVYAVVSQIDARTIQVQLVGQDVVGNVALVPPQLDLVPGPLSPDGIAGKLATFEAPTGGTPNISAVTPLTGQTLLVAGATGPDQIVFAAALPATPTNTDRLTIESVSRALRRTPLLEVILE